MALDSHVGQPGQLAEAITLHLHNVCTEEGIQVLALRTGGLLTHPWEYVPKASRATVLRGCQCPQNVCGGYSSQSKPEVGDAALEIGPKLS